MLQNRVEPAFQLRCARILQMGFPKVMADRVQLQQALMNLMLNGIEAMRDATAVSSASSRSWAKMVNC